MFSFTFQLIFKFHFTFLDYFPFYFSTLLYLLYLAFLLRNEELPFIGHHYVHFIDNYLIDIT